MIVMPMTHRDCGVIVAPRKRIGASPENASRPRASVPQTTTAIPRSMIPTPMVTMMPRHTSLPIGPMVHRSMTTATRPVNATANAIATSSGMPIWENVIASIAPIIALSPCAKLTTPVTL